MKPSTTTKILLFIFAASILLMLFSCGAEWHLKRAIALGAKVTHDSTKLDLVTPGSETDSTLHYKQLAEAFKKRNGELEGGLDPTFDDIIHDTITNETTKWRVITKIDTLTRTIYQKVSIKPDSLKVTVPTDTIISADTSRLKIIYISVGIGIILLLQIFIAYLARKWKR